MLDFVALAQECAPQVPHQTLAAIVKTESSFQPLTIGVNGGSRLARQPANKPEAVATAKWLIDHGYNIDLGLGQVNVKNLVKVGLTVEDAFEPCSNLAAAAKIFHANLKWAQGTGKADDAAVLAALSAYNTGSLTAGLRNGYVQRVVNNASTLRPAVGPDQDAPPIQLIAPRQSAKRLPAPTKPATGSAAVAVPGAPLRLTVEPGEPLQDAGVYSARPHSGVMVY